MVFAKLLNFNTTKGSLVKTSPKIRKVHLNNKLTEIHLSTLAFLFLFLCHRPLAMVLEKRDPPIETAQRALIRTTTVLAKKKRHVA